MTPPDRAAGLARAPSATDAAARPRRRATDPATLAQTEAAQPGVSVWVSANAGSGKTRVLTNRVARLLLAGAEPSRILCLTYTKAAAAEMQNRLFATLGRWAMADRPSLSAAVDQLLTPDEPALTGTELDAARKLFARALETPGGLKIQTIHAFCESLLSRFPLEAGVSPHFQVIDETTAAELLDAAQNDVARSRREDPALADAFERLFAHAAEATAQDLFAEALACRAAFARGGADPGGALAQALGASDRSGPEAVAARWRAALDAELVSRLAAALEGSASAREAARAAHLRAGLAAEHDEDAFLAIGQGLLNADLTRPKSGFPTKSFERDHPWALEPIARAQDALIAARAARDVAERLEASSAFATVARAVFARYRALKAARAGLDYDDLIDSAVGLLTQADARDWVRFKLDGGVEHILVDEAQDTSPAQWRVIGALAEEFFAGDSAREARASGQTPPPRTLFAVGDEKQSIYSFQGAAPELLAETGRSFAERADGAGRAFAHIDMATSFRSAPAVLDFVDATFATEAARKGLLFGARDRVSHRAHRRGQAGRVEIWPLVEPKAREDAPAWDQPVDAPPPDNPQRRLAALIAEQIRDWIGRARLPARGRTIRAGDVLVLVRKRGALSVGIIKRLKQLGVPVSGEDRLLLSGQLAVKDLLALGRFCLCPEDDLSLAAVLRSPFCDVSEDALFELAHGRDGNRRLWYALKEAARERAADHPEFARAERFLQKLIDRADYDRPFELFSTALTQDFGGGSGRARLVGRLGPEAEDPIDEFLSQTLGFETAATPTLQGFVRWMTARDAEIKREHDQGRDDVRVMTAHGAKGLEAPVVVLPDTTGPPGGGRAPKLLTPESDAPPIWLGPKKLDPPAVAALRAAKADREAEEHRRLLYVALTRAEDRLLIAGAVGKTGLPEGSWYALCADAAERLGAAPTTSPVADAAGAPLEGLSFESGDAAAGQAAEAETRPRPARDAPWLSRAAPAETAPSDLSPSKLGGDDPEANAEIVTRGSGLAAGAAASRGDLIHLLLELLPEVPPAQRRPRAEAILARHGGGFDTATRAAMVVEALGVLAMPEAPRLFGPGSRAEAPVGAVLPELGPGELHGVIDRLLVAPDAVLIVDFKTGAIPAAPPEAYLRQLAAYRAALRPLFADRPIEAALLWTAAPKLEPIPTPVLEDAFGRAAAALKRGA